MKKVININILDKSSIANAIAEVEKVEKKLKFFEANLEFAIEETVRIIGSYYSTAVDSGWGDDIDIGYRKTDKGYTIYAEGSDVAFIEFGAGVHDNGAESYKGERPEGIVGIGEYGSKQGSNPYWRWIVDGLPVDTKATNGMYEGFKFLEGEVERLCKEILK